MKFNHKLSFLFIISILCLCFQLPLYSDTFNNSTSGSSAGAGFEGDVGSNNKSYGAPIPGSPGFGPVINYFGNPLPSENFQPLEKITMYSCWFNRESLESILEKSEMIRCELKIANALNVPEDGNQWIKIVISVDKYNSDNLEFIGFVTSSSKSKNTTMVEVMAKSALAAMDAGANVIHFTAQGACRDAFSNGWGIGLSLTQAKISDQGNDSNVTSGGFGYSSAKAYMRDLPWLQGFALLDHDLAAPESTPVAAE